MYQEKSDQIMPLNVFQLDNLHYHLRNFSLQNLVILNPLVCFKAYAYREILMFIKHFKTRKEMSKLRKFEIAKYFTLAELLFSLE